MLLRDGDHEYGTHGGFYPCEDNALISMCEDKYTVRRMAEVLDRSYSSVVGRMKTLGLKNGSNGV